jgi:hypothetical protein
MASYWLEKSALRAMSGVSQSDKNGLPALGASPRTVCAGIFAFSKDAVIDLDRGRMSRTRSVSRR